MNELTDAHFEDLCRDSRVAAQIAGVEAARSVATRTFWIRLVLGIVGAIAILAAAIVTRWIVAGVILALFPVALGLVFGRIPLSRVGNAIKMPVLEKLAAMTGATFTERGFMPPAYANVRQILFGRVTESAFEDLFQGTAGSGQVAAFYEARLKRGTGRSTTLLFTGQVYVFQRSRRGAGETALLPETSMPDFFNAPNGMERVRFDSDPEFEAAFQVYSLRPGDAQSFLGQTIRRTLVELRKIGAVWVHVGPDEIFVGVMGKNKFEPGSLFSPMAGRDRVRIMFDDVRHAVASLNRIGAALA